MYLSLIKNPTGGIHHNTAPFKVFENCIFILHEREISSRVTRVSTYFQLRRRRPPFHKVRQFNLRRIFAIFQAFSKQCALENLFSNAKTLAAPEGGDLESQLDFFLRSL